MVLKNILNLNQPHVEFTVDFLKYEKTLKSNFSKNNTFDFQNNKKVIF